jgi:hypothetical protein
MKNPFPLRLLCLCLLVFPHLLSPAQNQFGIDLGGGLVVPTSAQLNKVFYTGGEMSLGFKVSVLPSKRLRCPRRTIQAIKQIQAEMLPVFIPPI